METFLGLTGFTWALFGAGVAAVLGGIGSAIGISLAAGTAAGVLSEDEAKFGQVLPLCAMPGTQGIYGFIAAVLVAVFFDILGGNTATPPVLGFAAFLACQPVAWLCLFTAIYQGHAAQGAISVVASEKKVPSLVFPALVETYAILALIITILMLLGIQAAL
ncbi:MAG: permease [Actinomycetes bacterium]|jgi:V/A-type H+-transporting ATPase subunit K|nr:permease [Actinomycetes bacterium]